MTSVRFAALLFVTAAASAAWGQEPAACLSSDPSAWPARSKPYFMVIADSSSSMNTSVATSNSCGLPNTRNGHLKCALRNMISAYAGLAHFGLATYATQQTGCDAACGTCVASDLPGGTNGCGPGSGATRAGANIVVPLVQDNFWSAPPNPNNTTGLLSWVDGTCTGNTELQIAGQTPLNGVLRDMQRYLQTQWAFPGGGSTYATPLASAAQGERACRPVNVILVTDSDENCDTLSDAVAAAAQLAAGVTVGGNTFPVRTWVINFAGATQAALDQIAAAGGTGTAISAINEAQLAQAFGTIVQGRLVPETCNNQDDDCNGCTDEGFRHFCRINATCCAWATAAQRATCVATFQGSITPANPHGDPALLPCTTAAQASNPATWLCYDPGDTCDGVDNNCVDGVDEGAQKCGSPAHCPAAETCNGLDDDCDGLIDEALVCP